MNGSTPILDALRSVRVPECDSPNEADDVTSPPRGAPDGQDTNNNTADMVNTNRFHSAHFSQILQPGFDVSE